MYKTISEAAKDLLQVSYYNGKVKRALLAYLKERNLNIQDILLPKPVYFCLNCGKQLAHKHKFCSRNCSASYLNKRKTHSEETKKKISSTLKNRYSNVPRNNIGKRLFESCCELCGKTFWSRHKNTRFCSPKCSANSPITKEKQKAAQQRLIELGIHTGWSKRNIMSYAEKFWQNVLTNNNISYIKEDHSTGHYFLDFLISKNGKKIDLEIDGKQHKYKDRAAHDKQRDIYLQKRGYIVYRIPWNSINTDAGKVEMKQKIDKFLEFYNSI